MVVEGLRGTEDNDSNQSDERLQQDNHLISLCALCVFAVQMLFRFIFSCASSWLGIANGCPAAALHNSRELSMKT